MSAGASCAIVAFGAVSALGEGWDAASAGKVGERACVAIAHDAELAACGLARPFAARVALGPIDDEADRATKILTKSLRACAASLDAARPGWRASRVGLAIGTSSGGMRTAQTLFARVARGESVSPALAARSAYFGPLLDAVADIDMTFSPASLVLCACASSVLAIGLASRWLAGHDCDLVLAGGFDAVSPFVASGFEALRATTAAVPPRPFREGRDGMALGEAGGVLALVREEDARPNHVIGYVCGFGAAADAVHLTAPDRDGTGLARAARAAIEEASGPRIDLVSAHGTATPFNDAAESRAIFQVLGTRDVPVHAFKAQVGHTLGAAGVLESLVTLDALARGVLPATAGGGAPDPEAPARVLERGESSAPRAALKLASAFGGANAALVLGREASRAQRTEHDAWVTRAARVSAPPDLAALAEATGVPHDRLARADAHVTWSLAAVAALASRIGRDALAGAGVVVGTAAATLETNALFAARLRDRGARFVEPRRFPYTSPNAVAGECGIAFGLTGPGLSVGCGLHAAVEALAVAWALVRAGDAERMVVVAVDDVAELGRAWAATLDVSLSPGAIALLVTRDRGPSSAARIRSAHTVLGPSRTLPVAGRAGHLALAALDADVLPRRVTASSILLGTCASATVELVPN